MRTRHLAALAALTLLSVALVAPVGAHAATIHVNKGVAKASLGMRGTTAANGIGKVTKKVIDRDYNGAGLTYTIRYFGKKSAGKHPVVMYSNNKNKVIAFAVHSPKHKTAKGIHVGSSVASLTSAYGAALKPSGDDAYRLKAASGSTFFNVSNGKVTSIWIWKI